MGEQCLVCGLDSGSTLPYCVNHWPWRSKEQWVELMREMQQLTRKRDEAVAALDEALEENERFVTNRDAGHAEVRRQRDEAAMALKEIDDELQGMMNDLLNNPDRKIPQGREQWIKALEAVQRISRKALAALRYE